MRPTTTPLPNNKSPRLLKLIIVFLALLGVLAVVSTNRQGIQDWVKLRSYTAPANVAQLADDDTMTAYARRVFYVNEPQIDGKDIFGPKCPSGTEQTVVLGCYKGGQSGIVLLQVNDPRLQGVEQVTAAHETLHAVYERLSPSKRKQVDAWLNDYFKNQLRDQTVIDQINSYKQTEPKDLTNEMHSIIGSEVGNLPPVLEEYYSQYFANRSVIVGFYDKYQEEFTSRQDKIKQDDVQLSALKAQIDSAETGLKAKADALESQRNQLDALRSSGQIPAYNAGVPGYNAGVNAYNAEVARLRDLIDQYNSLVDERNSIALETQQLTSEITSDTQPIPR